MVNAAHSEPVLALRSVEELSWVSGETTGEAETSVSTTDAFPPTGTDAQLALMRTLVNVSDTLTEDFSVDRTLGYLINACQALIAGADVSVVLADKKGKLYIAASSSERRSALDDYQIQRNEGPGISTFLTGEDSTYKLVDTSGFPWPLFGEFARSVGYEVLRSIPIRLREETIGILNIAESVDVAAPPMQRDLLRVLADTTAIGLVHRREYLGSNELSNQLQTALTTRVLVEQAKGAVAARLGLSVDEAFEMLRSHARSNNKRLDDVSAGVLDGSIATHDLWATRKSSLKKSVGPIRGSVTVPDQSGSQSCMQGTET